MGTWRENEAAFTYEAAEQNTLQKGLFACLGAVQPENWYPMRWADAGSGFFNRWMEMCTERNVLKGDEVEKAFADEQAETELADLFVSNGSSPTTGRAR